MTTIRYQALNEMGQIEYSKNKREGGSAQWMRRSGKS